MTRSLLIDIETFPNTVRTWGIYKQHALEVLEYPIVCSYSAKWLGGEHITRILPDTPKYKPSKRDDYYLVEEVWKLLNEAETVIAQYGDGFDMPMLQARFAFHGFQPPSPFRTVDTKKIAAKVFHFGGSYSLDHMVQYLQLGEKMATGGYELWQGCIAGDASSWAKMRKYNAHDVVLLERLYYKLLPWMNDHPNISEFPDGCPKCGSRQLQQRGTARSRTRTYKRLQCQGCGGWLRSTKSIASSVYTNA